VIVLKRDALFKIRCPDCESGSINYHTMGRYSCSTCNLVIEDETLMIECANKEIEKLKQQIKDAEDVIKYYARPNGWLNRGILIEQGRMARDYLEKYGKQ
jgi:DNA-directed RNA polymerase subunit RPC12/RpoP